MGKKASSTPESQTDVLSLLNQVLELEYSLIIHYPRLASAIRDERRGSWLSGLALHPSGMPTSCPTP